MPEHIKPFQKVVTDKTVTARVIETQIAEHNFCLEIHLDGQVYYQNKYTGPAPVPQKWTPQGTLHPNKELANYIRRDAARNTLRDYRTAYNDGEGI